MFADHKFSGISIVTHHRFDRGRRLQRPPTNTLAYLDANVQASVTAAWRARLACIWRCNNMLSVNSNVQKPNGAVEVVSMAPASNTLVTVRFTPPAALMRRDIADKRAASVTPVGLVLAC